MCGVDGPAECLDSFIKKQGNSLHFQRRSGAVCFLGGCELVHYDIKCVSNVDVPVNHIRDKQLSSLALLIVKYSTKVLCIELIVKYRTKVLCIELIV